MNYIFLSDIHLSCDPAGTGKPYTWIDFDGRARLASFLHGPEVWAADKLFLVGDIVDTWVHPIDNLPPTVSEILWSPVNDRVVEVLQEYAMTPGKQLVWIPGNHDMETTLDDVRKVFGTRVVFGRQYDEACLRVRHGHEGSLFNAPDPSGRPYPIGYFITRMTATAVNRGRSDVSLNLWTVLKHADEAKKLLGGEPVNEAIFNAILNATGLSWNDQFVMPDGVLPQGRRVMSMREACDWYQRLIPDWQAKHGSVRLAVEAEWDPWYDLPATREHINIVGHSHVSEASTNETYGYYLNTGTWCTAGGAEPSYVHAWDEGDSIAAQVVNWNRTRVGESTIVRMSKAP